MRKLLKPSAFKRTLPSSVHCSELQYPSHSGAAGSSRWLAVRAMTLLLHPLRWPSALCPLHLQDTRLEREKVLRCSPLRHHKPAQLHCECPCVTGLSCVSREAFSHGYEKWRPGFSPVKRLEIKLVGSQL